MYRRATSSKLNIQGPSSHFSVAIFLVSKMVPVGQTNDDYHTYHFDRRGSTIALTDTQGQVTAHMTYSSYGQVNILDQADMTWSRILVPIS